MLNTIKFFLYAVGSVVLVAIAIIAVYVAGVVIGGVVAMICCYFIYKVVFSDFDEDDSNNNKC